MRQRRLSFQGVGDKRRSVPLIYGALVLDRENALRQHQRNEGNIELASLLQPCRSSIWCIAEEFKVLPRSSLPLLGAEP